MDKDIEKMNNKEKESVQILEKRIILGKEFTIYGTFDEPLFLAKEIAEFIDYSFKDSRQIHRDVSKMLSTIDEDEKTKIFINPSDSIAMILQPNTEYWFVTKNGFSEIIAKSRKLPRKRKLEILEELNISNEHKSLVIYYKEIEFFNKLETILEIFNINYEKQYKIFNYKIDMYLPKLNLAIEYDENDHKCYSYEQQELRQKEIEEELGCKFIRVSDKDRDELNIGLILKEFMVIK